MTEFFRPWKLATLMVGLAWLIYGALYYNIGDWDVGISLIMGLMTYALAPWCVRTIYVSIRNPNGFRLSHVLIALFAAWFTVDGVYMAYHTLVGNPTYRWANFYASSTLFVLAGSIWAYQGSIAQLVAELRTEFDSRRNGS